MPCLKKYLLKNGLNGLNWLAQLGVCSLIGLLMALPAMAQTGHADIVQLTAARLDKNVVISAQVKFELPSSIEDAMYKGVSLTFVSDVEITKERWYWADKSLATATRQIRVSYQALTRRWRVLPWSDLASQGGLGVQLPQTYETLPEALAIAQRIHNWRVADSAEMTDGNLWLTLRYRLDISQLPKPLQIGLLGQGDWSISAATRQRLVIADAKDDVKP